MNGSCVHRRWVLSLLTVAAFSVLVAAAGQTPPSKRVVLYAAVGPELTSYDVDVDAATLTKRRSMTLPGSVTEAAFHPSKKYFYPVWRDALPGAGGSGNHEHGLGAFRIDPASGALLPHGQPLSLSASPGYISYVETDIPGMHLVAADSDPSRLIVYRIAPDGTIGPEIKAAGPLDFGIHAHQIRVDPSNNAVILVARGNRPTSSAPEQPGALKIYRYKDGVLANSQSIAPGGGFNYQPRHLDFHPSGRWDFVTLEPQNKLFVYQRKSDGTLGGDALFTKDTLADPGNVRPGQIAGTVHVHPNGRFVYVANRASGTMDFGGQALFVGGENTVAVFAINQDTGEPTLVQNIATRGIHARTFALDPSGKILVAGNTRQLFVREGAGVRALPASLAVFRVRVDGQLDFVRKYDVDVGRSQLFWMAMITLP